MARYTFPARLFHSLLHAGFIPAHPPYRRVRIRRFSKLSPCGPEVRIVVRHKGFATLLAQCHCEFDVLLLTLTVWAFLTSVSTTPAADFCCRISVNYSTLSPESRRATDLPEISSIAFHAQPPNLRFASLID